MTTVPSLHPINSHAQSCGFDGDGQSTPTSSGQTCRFASPLGRGRELRRFTLTSGGKNASYPHRREKPWKIVAPAVSGNKCYSLCRATLDQGKIVSCHTKFILEATKTKGISQISFFGISSGTVTPEPGTIFVWGLLALSGYFGAKKWQAKA
jgi:hypothetical protein